MNDWSPSAYLKFEDERTRPARDLLAQVPLARLRKGIDVGCGPGNSTQLLIARYPGAEIIGLDNSPAMLAQARTRAPEARFETADAAVWIPDPDADLVFANASYQWIARPIEHLPRVLAALRPGAVLAVQMPDNLAEPVHALMTETASSGPWAQRLTGAARNPLPPPRAFYDALKPWAQRVDIWRTIYYHVLADAAAIVEWMGATGLRPFLDPLSDAERAAFRAAYLAKIAAAYRPAADGDVVLPFPRLFFLAQR
jgi:trans-aconitate 2-methyltransferase